MCELWLELEAGRKQAKRAHERDVYLAFYCEFMARQKELGQKSLHALLRTTNRQTPPEMKQALLHIAEVYGLKVTVKKKGQA